jgi:hypothetical protein
MDWNSFGMINNHTESQRVVVMATKNTTDNVWEEIFDSLILNAEPPPKYVKRVTVTTTKGEIINMTPQDFSTLLRHEKSLPPGVSDIQSARLSLDFNKIRKDVDKWTEDMLSGFDQNGKPGMPKFSKPKAVKSKSVQSKTPAAKIKKSTNKK